MTILVSEELQDKIDVSQFYDPPSGDISLSIDINENHITGQVSQMRCSGVKLSIKFSCDRQDATSLITSRDEDIECISLFSGSSLEPAKRYNISSILSKSLKLVENGSYMCSLMVRVK